MKHIMRKFKIVNFVRQGHFEWNTDLIETKKLENYTWQVAQDLYSGFRTSLARKLGLRILDGTNGDD